MESSAKLPLKYKLSQLVAALTFTILAISDGMHYGWTAPVLPILRTTTKITKSEEIWLESLFLIGSLTSLPITTYLVNQIGRKKTVTLAACISVATWTIIALNYSIQHLFAARFIAGITSDAVYVAGPMYISEIADQTIRGFLSALTYTGMLVGILIIYTLAPFCPFYVPSVIASALLIGQLVALHFIPESPYFLVSKKKHQAARRSLVTFVPSVYVDGKLLEITESVAHEKREKGQFRELFCERHNRNALIIVTVIIGAQHCCGISVVLMNLHTILATAGSHHLNPNSAGIIFSALMLFAAVSASFCVDKYGRKCLLVVSSLATGLCLLTLALYVHLKCLGFFVSGDFSWVPLVAVMAYAVAFKMGLGLVPIILASELFSSRVKGFALSLCDVFYVGFGLVSIEFYQRVGDLVGIYVPFYVFGVLSFGAVGFTVFVVPETKGSTLEEIQVLLKRSGSVR